MYNTYSYNAGNLVTGMSLTKPNGTVDQNLSYSYRQYGHMSAKTGTVNSADRAIFGTSAMSVLS